jgi:hypothetical protein
MNFLAGADIDVDNLLPEQISNYHDQALLITRNPAIAAKFFNIQMKVFISAVLGYDPKHRNLTGGILGHVSGYYRCVKAQGCGTLHCHMLIWIEGALNPNEICEHIMHTEQHEFCTQLLAFLDNTISNSIPDDPAPEILIPSSIHHPCSIHGIDLKTTPENWEQHLQKDLHYLASKCQSHRSP